MACVLIGYDVNKTGQDYTDLIEEIKRISATRWHCLDSTWILKTDQSPKAIRDQLKGHVDDNDELLVIALQREAAWHGFSDKCSNWLQNNLWPRRRTHRAT
ncbi:MAG: hypothetical protein JNL19_03385 [Burkholderiales bacterium]|nr:hypothetical protein [Burkholderiales bacterium]